MNYDLAKVDNKWKDVTKKFLNIIQEIKTDHDNDPNANARLYRLPKMPDP